MKQQQPGNCSVAWFKLAECVSRGEKERALAVYRLLSHSIGDEAIALQLEGDILHSFGDNEAEERYLGAISLYQRDGRTIEATAVYEKLVHSLPAREDYAMPLIDAYLWLGWKWKALGVAEEATMRLYEEKGFDPAVKFINKLEQWFKDHDLVPCRKTLVLRSLDDGEYDPEELLAQSAKIVEAPGLELGEEGTFLDSVKSVDPKFHELLLGVL